MRYPERYWCMPRLQNNQTCTLTKEVTLHSLPALPGSLFLQDCNSDRDYMCASKLEQLNSHAFQLVMFCKDSTRLL